MPEDPMMRGNLLIMSGYRENTIVKDQDSNGIDIKNEVSEPDYCIIPLFCSVFLKSRMTLRQPLLHRS